uniref:CST complex subunit CTC1 n=1 Tax=Stegastes partitus TaxID=144197 RepID=A0A3B4ZN24_9TELE
LNDPLILLFDSLLQESTWLKNLFTFITEHLSPVACGPAPPACSRSRVFPSVCRLLSISELVSQQRVACVSNLSWSTNEQRAWAREAELSVPGQQALPRVNLLLIGCLREGRGSEWRLTDSSGSVRCEVSQRRRGLQLVSCILPPPSKLCWSQCVCVGQSVCVTVLRVCVLRGWRGNNILCVTDCSELHTDYTPRHTQDLTQAPAEHTPTNMDMPLMMMSHASDDSEEAEPDVQSGGIVTKVVSEGAGLYVIDGRVGLCLAYQPMPKRKLRAGDRVELHHVHFLFKPCPDFPPSMLCCCLRSSLKVTAFSRVGGGCPAPRCPGDGTLPRLLLQGHRGVSEYLWVCHLSSQMCLVSSLRSWTSCGWMQRRDIYSEMLDEPHTCPVTQVVLHTWRLGCPLCYCSVFTVSLQVYLQFSLDHVHILSSSVAMVAHLRQKGEESGSDVTARSQRAEEETTAGRKRRREDTGASHSASTVTKTTSSVGSSPRPCVSVVIRVEQKEGVAWMNTGAGTTEKAGLTLCFSARAAVIGPVVRWGQDPKNGPMTSREAEREGEDKVRDTPGSHDYLLIAASTQVNTPVMMSLRGGAEVSPLWRLLFCCKPLLKSCKLKCLFLRIPLFLLCVCSGVSLTLCDQSGRSLKVYLDLSHTPYPPGLLPGNTLLLSAFQRRQSRIGSVYCTFLPVSSITVISLGDTSLAPPPPPAPIMHLGPWALSSEQRCIVGQVKGHVVCFLFLQLQWSCSLCGSVYTQVHSQCRSTSSIFQSNAKLVIDDGTGEAHVWFSGALVRSLLGLADSQWEGLQRALRVKGHIRVYPRGRSLVCNTQVYTSTCFSLSLSLSLSLRCIRLPLSLSLRCVTVTLMNFSTTLLRPLQLTCLHLH